MVLPKVERVSAGEVCSIDIAKNYGFYDDAKYYTQDYRDVKTYNAKLDIDERRDSNEVCTQTPNGAVAYPLCSLVYGIPYEQDPKDMSRCVIDLKRSGVCSPKDVKGTQCKRSNVLLPPPEKMSAHCDEKPTDWYMIPNYHLGNKYNFIERGSGKTRQTVCMKPCPADRMPGYVNDPAADGASAGIMANTKVDRCYTKDEYMSGKYSDTNNFCPIAWVYRLGQRQEEIVDSLINEINDTSGTSNAFYKKSVAMANQDAKNIYIESKKMLENVDYTDDVVTNACSQFNTPERLNKAYQICSDISKNPKAFDDVLKNNAQKKVLKQACNALFCDSSQDLAGSIEKDPICINIDPEKTVPGDDLLKNDKDIASSTNTDAVVGSPPKVNEVTSLDKGAKNTNFMIIFGIVMIVLTFLGIIIMISWKYIGPTIKKVWCYILYAVRMILPEALYDTARATNNLGKCTIWASIPTS